MGDGALMETPSFGTRISILIWGKSVSCCVLGSCGKWEALWGKPVTSPNAYVNACTMENGQEEPALLAGTVVCTGNTELEPEGWRK